MQVMIDLAEETPASLRMIAQLIQVYADAKEHGNVVLPPVPNAPTAFTPPPPPPIPSAPAAFAPPPPPPPLAPVVSLPVASTPVAAIPPAAVVPPTTILTERDSQGMPWDSRIHQKKKGVKADGTWKLQKGIDPTIVSAVTQELHARMQASGINTPAPAGAVAPVSLPPAPPVVPPQAVPVPPAPQAQGFAPPPFPPGAHPSETQAQAPQAPVSPLPPVPVPPAPHVGMPDAGNAGMVSDIGGPTRALVAKMAAARGSGRLTQDGLNRVLMQAGVPSVQMLSSMAHLVPTVDAYLDLELATAP